MADCTKAHELIEGIAANCLIADKGYDAHELLLTATERGMEAVIPPRSNRKEQREYDKYLYKLRHLVENMFLILKQWRGIATRYAKRQASYLAAIQLRSAVLWAKIS